MTKKDIVGIILSNGDTSSATCQLLKDAENEKISEGKLLLVKSNKRKLLSRVSKIIPYNAFYTVGDPWSEARRDGKPIPENIARQYEICELELLMEIPQKEIVYPPRPGDTVEYVDLTEYENYEEVLFNVSPKKRIGKSQYKGIIHFGSLSGYSNLPIPLDVEKVPMHIGIFGVTGSGKSFNTGYLIEKFVNIPKNESESIGYPMVIIDAHGDYLDYIDYVEKNNLVNIEWIKSKTIKRYVFPKVYLKPEFRSSTSIEPIGINLDLLKPSELAELIVTFLKGKSEGAEQQINGLIRAFENLKVDGYSSINDLFCTDAGRRTLMNRIDRLGDDHSFFDATLRAIKNQLREFFTLEDRYNLFSSNSPLKEPTFIDDITQNHGIAIIDFSSEGAPGVDLKIKQIIMTYLAGVLFEKFSEYKLNSKQKYLMFLIEEAQNFCPDRSYPISNSLTQTKLSAIATQGRKFGLSLCLITQRPSFVDRIILSMCNTFFIQRISPEDVNFVKGVTGGLPQSLVKRLTTLNTGNLLITGQMVTVPFPLEVRVDYDQRIVKPTVGETNVIDNL
jgi:uncharacterized protein